ncbi:ABC transporter ATP-binding protein [Bradyrhizobium sp. 187]|uniref:ABC transporter ATP-binding protein n=1 Tax=Bradyrhizobium sp. 187 TaxID=2782655 RepID=UPI0020002693|nr:ABC transporter ATP-binding protein [Bradyrhizobium sp. 187]UPJ71859.1 ABC transporter ATP-binding protein [Bradyrhizobium sp. 187]
MTTFSPKLVSSLSVPMPVEHSTPEKMVVSANDVSFAYGTMAPTVVGFDLAVRPGEIVSIVGPSGCGKSTLLRLFSGLRQPTSGTVERNFGQGSRHGCSMVFQEDTLLPWLKVKDNVALYYRFTRRRAADKDRHVAELLEMVGLTKFADYYPYQLSGGMKRRVAILTAVAPTPDLLLLDEPFSALDEPTRIGVHSDLYMLLRKLNITAILVTHDLAEATCLSDRVVILSRPPSHVVEEIRIPFGESREMMNLRDDPRFLQIYGQLWHTLKGQIAGLAREVGDARVSGVAP